MRFIKNIFIGLTLLLGFGACQNEDLPTTSGEGKGRLVVGNVIVDVSTKDGVAITRAADGTFTAPDASELTYTLTNNTTGEVEYEQKEVPADVLLAIGNYTLKAVYGENRMGTIPYLYKSVTFDIEKGKITNLTDFTVGLACAIIRPVISPELEAQYKNGLTLSLSDGTNVLSDIVNGTDYFVPSAQNYTLTCRGTNLIGKENSFSTSVNSAETKTRYNLNCNPDFPVFQLPEQAEGNAWAKRIYITPMTEKDITDAKGMSPQDIINQITYRAINKTNPNDIAVSHIDTDSQNIVITGLNGSTTYTIDAVLGGISSSNTQEITTEDVTDIPNGSLDTYCITAGKDGSSTNRGAVFEWYTSKDEIDSWWITNNQTTSENRNTLSYSHISRSGTRPTNDAISKNAAQIMTIGYKYKFGQTVNVSGPTATDYGFLNISKRNFKSRPTAIAFYYKYIPYKNDEPLVEIKLYTDNKEFGKAQLEAPYSSTYNNSKTRIEIIYDDLFTKISAIELKLISGTQHKEVAKRNGAAGNDAMPAYIGSQLFIDEIELIYE